LAKKAADIATAANIAGGITVFDFRVRPSDQAADVVTGAINIAAGVTAGNRATVVFTKIT